ncbi:MAG: helix-turn-helix domain-containing protein [Prevotella sp.]
MSLMMRLLHVLSTTPPLATLLAEQRCPIARNDKASSIDRAYHYIYEHFRENMPLDRIAAYSGLNPSALCRSFKKSSGCTIGQLCSRLRIEYACNLLLITKMDVAQIAFLSGYNSYPHFCTRFKSAMKVSPTEYRGGTGGVLPDK